MGKVSLGDVELKVDVIGNGPPLVLMHGGPGVDHTTMSPFRKLRDRFTLVFYDHRCNGRSVGPDITTMTWENLTGDADALRRHLGFDTWAVLGHSFGGMVAMEYTLRYPDRVSHLVLADTAGDAWWVQEQAPQRLAQLGYPPGTVELARRFYNGEIVPGEMTTGMRKFGSAFFHNLSPWLRLRVLPASLRMKLNPEALIHGFGHLLKGWSTMDRLEGITAPTLVLAGSEDFQFPPQHQIGLAAAIPGAHLELIEGAGHNAHWERPKEVIAAVRAFLR